MSTNHTQNYDLCQWEPSDKVIRLDFNADNAKIDTALAAIQAQLDALSARMVPPFVTGTYRGSGITGQSINLGFRPSAVLVMRDNGGAFYTGNLDTYASGGLAVGNVQVIHGEYLIMHITDTGFKVYSDGRVAHANDSASSYMYVAFR